MTIWACARKMASSHESRKMGKYSTRFDNCPFAPTTQPQQARFAWELARTKLEAYFDRNLELVRLVFFAAVLTMIAGFGLVGYGIILSLSRPETIKPSLVAAGSGILTEFIAATFMVIYRSTMLQAASYMSVLERINTVGMAVQILDSIPEESAAIKNETRASMTKQLLQSHPEA
ncbi:MAG: hypothetical protein WA604_21525 [Candidatus Sulfotelmatobacter sp.]